MKTSANTHSGLKRNENFASTGKDLRDWPGRTGRGILRLMSVGMALPVWVFYLFAVWVFARCSVWFLTALLRVLAFVFLILILACLFV